MNGTRLIVKTAGARAKNIRVGTTWMTTMVTDVALDSWSEAVTPSSLCVVTEASQCGRAWMPLWCFWSASAPRRQEQALRRVGLVARRLRRANSQEPGGHKGPPGAAASSSASVLSRTDQSLDKEALARLAAAALASEPILLASVR